MPVTFENSSVVSVQVPDGRWFDVRILTDDGAWHIAERGPLYGAAGLLAMVACGILRVLYWLRRSQRKTIVVHSWQPDEMSRKPVRREHADNEAAARAVAQRLHGELSRGELVP